MSAYTPGPLVADGYNVRQPGGRHCAYTGPHHTPESEYPPQCRREDEANAVLYAAAPDMAGAIKTSIGNVRSLCQTNPGAFSEWLAMLEAAAKKAGVL
jgi:hypothetical protein